MVGDGCSRWVIFSINLNVHSMWTCSMQLHLLSVYSHIRSEKLIWKWEFSGRVSEGGHQISTDFQYTWMIVTYPLQMLTANFNLFTKFLKSQELPICRMMYVYNCIQRFAGLAFFGGRGSSAKHSWKFTICEGLSSNPCGYEVWCSLLFSALHCLEPKFCVQ